MLSVFVIHNRTCSEFTIDDTSKHVVPSTVCPAIEFVNDDAYFNPCLYQRIKRDLLEDVANAFPHPHGEGYDFDDALDLDKIDANNLYEQYKKLLETSEKHFYISGNVDIEKLKNFFEEKFEKADISDSSNIVRTKKDDIKVQDVKNVFEHMDVTQGKLVLGYDVDVDLSAESFYKMLVYNAILGSSSNSKLFQNVREKASLAYTTRSTYIKHKGVLLVTAGIELDKHDKALELIEIQVDDMKKGNFTDEDLKDAKVFLENLFTSCLDDQTTMIELSIGQFIAGIPDDVEQMVEKIKNVSRDDVVEVANKLTLVTNYYLAK